MADGESQPDLGADLSSPGLSVEQSSPGDPPDATEDSPDATAQPDATAAQSPDEAAAFQKATDASAVARRRQRLDRIFGDVLPEATRDDLASSGDEEQAGRDVELLRDVPPHHDR